MIIEFSRMRSTLKLSKMKLQYFIKIYPRPKAEKGQSRGHLIRESILLSGHRSCASLMPKIVGLFATIAPSCQQFTSA